MSYMLDRRPCLCWVQVATLADEQLHSMGAQRLCSRGLGDEDTGKMVEQFSSWTQSLLNSMKHRSTLSDHSATADTVDGSDGYVRQKYVVIIRHLLLPSITSLVMLASIVGVRCVGMMLVLHALVLEFVGQTMCDF